MLTNSVADVGLLFLGLGTFIVAVAIAYAVISDVKKGDE